MSKENKFGKEKHLPKEVNLFYLEKAKMRLYEGNAVFPSRSISVGYLYVTGISWARFAPSWRCFSCPLNPILVFDSLNFSLQGPFQQQSLSPNLLLLMPKFTGLLFLVWYWILERRKFGEVLYILCC